MVRLVSIARPIVIIAGLLLLFTAPAMAGTISVCSSGCNYTSIQDAVNNAVDGDTIEIYSGQYNEAVVVNRSITLAGIDTGTGLPVINASGAEFGVILESPDILLYRLNITGANSSAILLENDGAELLELMVVHHKEEQRELEYPAVKGENITDISISSCTFDVSQDCVALHDLDDYSITGNTFLNPVGYSVAIVSSGNTIPTTNGVISGNSITQKRGGGVAIVARSANGLVENLTIADNTISGSGGSIGLFIPSEGVVIQNNTLQENPEAISMGKGIYGIMTYGTSGVTITDNSAYGTDVELAYRIESCSDMIITDNTVDSNSDTGMGFIGITNSTVSGNTMDNNVYNFWMSPVVLDPGELPGNQIDQTNLVDGKPVWYFEATDGISVESSDNLGVLFLYACDNADVRDYTFTANSDGVMALVCDNLTITNCSFQQLYRGIMAVKSPQLTIQDNYFTGCFDGMMIGDFHDGQISGNQIQDSRDSGIVAGVYLEDVEVSDNVIDTAVAGIVLDDVSGFNNVVFDGNTIRYTLTAGISSTESGGAVISNNYLDPDGGVGFDLSYTDSLNITGNTLSGMAGLAVLMTESSDNSINSNILSSTGSGFVMERKNGEEGCSDNLVYNNRINSPESVQFCLREMPGEEIDRMKFGVEPMTPPDEIPSTTLVSGEDPDTPADFSCTPDPSPPANIWNVTKTAGPNIVGGPFIGGNYWAKPDGTGWSQVTPDRGDGFCTAPFVVNADNTDYLPLHMHEGEIEITAPAVIDSPGRYRLVNDLVNSTVDKAILISSSDVYFNGDGHTLGGAFQLDTCGVLADDDGLENITIANLTVTGWQRGIAINRVSGITLQDTLSTGNSDGFDVNGSTGITIRDCNSIDNLAMPEQGVYFGGTGITMSDSSSIWIIDSDFIHNGWGEELPYVGGYGILSTNTPDLVISGCTVSGNVNTGIDIEFSENPVVVGNQIHENGGNGGIFMAFPDPDSIINSTIADNTISDNGYGIWLEHRGHQVSNNTVTDCEWGVLLASCEEATLTGNVLSGNTRNFGVGGEDYVNYLNWVDTTNTIEGLPIYYLVGESGRVVDSTTGAGIVIAISCTDLEIRDLTLSKNAYGVLLYGSERVTITNVTSTDNLEGFDVQGGKEINFDACTGRENEYDGFLVEGSELVTISGSDAVENSGPFGLGTGVAVHHCMDVLILDTDASDNNYAGIDMENSDQVFVEGVTADSNNAAGIIFGGDDIAITGCLIRDNEGPGLGMFESGNVTIWNNFFSNDINAEFDTGVTSALTWNVTKIASPNIVDGPFIGGNYWAKPDGTGWSQVTPDRGDGFCTAPFVIDSNNTDYLPLHTRTAPPFFADFTAVPLEGEAPLTVQFTDQSNGNPIQYLYDFGDGFTSRSKNPVHTYLVPGDYTVSLKIWRIEGSTLVETSTVKEDLVRVTGEPVPGLEANFTAEPLSGTAPLSVSFMDTSTGNPMRWKYDFGDGTSSTARNPAHVYRVPGTYDVSLTVFAIDGSRLISNTTVKVDLVTVEGTPVPGLEANFTAEPLSGTAPLSVAFTDTSTGDPQFWKYDFGDGFSSSSPNPEHTYRWPGTFTVKLTVTGFGPGHVLVTNSTTRPDLITVE
jgi:parallel beta-helix repeat protein